MLETSIAELVERLFETHRRPDNKEYSLSEVATKLKTFGISVDSTTLGKVRSGEISNPGRRVLLGLCQFFRVPASYFFPELDAFGPEDEVSPEDQLRAAFRTLGVPTDIQAHLVAVAKAFKQDKEQDKSNE